MKLYGRVELRLQAFLTSTLYGYDWSASRFSSITSGERAPGKRLDVLQSQSALSELS
jgi:hypothetical protein